MDQSVQTPNTQPVTPQQTPPAHRNIVPLVIVGVIAALLASGGTYFVMSSNQNKQSQMTYQQNTVSQLSPTETLPSPTTPVAEPTTDATANWKTYTSAKLSFKYPPTLYVQETDKDFLVLTKGANTPAQNAELSIDARLSNTYTNYTTAVDKTKEGLTNVTTETLPNGVKIKGKIGPGFGEGTSIVVALLKYNQGAVAIENSTNPLQEDLLNQILATVTLK